MGKSFVYNTGSSEDDVPKKHLELTFGIFIDGTLNNKYNTDLRTEHGRKDADGNEIKNKNGEELSNTEIEEKDDKAYKKVKNKSRIRELVEKENRTQAEQNELDAMNPKDVYLVASHRYHFNPLTWNFSTDRFGTDNSYSNDYTNVARMWTCCEEEDYRIYVEGMGTEKKSRDSQDGFAFGSGRTGIRGRVRNACEQLGEKIFKIKDSNSTKTITQITLDVFGFSRGAAAARNFVYEVNKKSAYEPKTRAIQDGYYPPNPKTGMATPKYKQTPCDDDGILIDTTLLIDGKMPRLGHLGYCLLQSGVVTPEELEEIKVIVRFLGVYDTVSSYYENNNDGGLGQYKADGSIIDDSQFPKVASEGITSKNFKNDVEELALNSFGYVQKVVHFTAKDEHRKNFDLTRIHNANLLDRIIEKNLPGVHCDVGGAYQNEPEIIEKLETVHFCGNLSAYREQLIKEYWFKDEEIDIDGRILNFLSTGLIPKTIHTERNLRKEYSYIPLHFMEEFCKETAMDGFFSRSVEDEFPLGNDEILNDVKRGLSPYVFGSGKEWEFKTDEELEEIKERKEIEAFERSEETIDEKQERELQEKLQKEEQEEELRFKKNTAEMEDSWRRFYPDGAGGISYDKDMTPSLDSDTVIENLNEPDSLEVDNEPIIDGGELEEIVLIPVDVQKTLRALRGKYFHWSSHRNWFGMEPNDNRIRNEH